MINLTPRYPLKRRQDEDQNRSALLLPEFEPRIVQPVAVRLVQRVNHHPGASCRLSDGDVPVLPMLQAVIRQPVTTEATVRSLASPGWIFGGRSGTGAGFASSTWIVPCHYYSINSPCLLIVQSLTLYIELSNH